MTETPDYELADSLELSTPEQYRALFEDTRTEIVMLLLERAATTSELAESLGRPKGTVGHHLKVLEEAGLVRVVRTRKVRALEAKYYGRTARTFYYQAVNEARGLSQRTLADVSAEITQLPAELADQVNVNLRYARIPADRVAEWNERVGDLLVEFGTQPRSGETTYGLAIALYPTGRSSLPESEGPAPEDRPESEGRE
ncbi:ArsR/SmtB family transcription factor [Nocardiopsis metallicus]|uniref:DNA-binding transcriptional ArsR family regulator n=1 Tax=Nocardiopsis metallicus TaxID=179819 RepID=A0A840WCB1_9ACTN|nr:winged helix-turn-helix domain-containing protein [Nocardiopsis metallicus]MBB5490661.1 DNA-binding transcriptional ArsR family regulator [Nocardiopsis metallicus]